jgi:mannose-6-phosphate isomerase-like protein (cupin superfamily)
MTNRLDQNYIHLGLGATAMPQPPFTGMAWYEDYGSRTTSDGAEGRLVSLSTFTQSWDSWEMHPDGDEVLIFTAGRMTLHQQFADGTTASVTIGAGEYTINPPGCWHTADVEGEATAVFITCGQGTQGRQR